MQPSFITPLRSPQFRAFFSGKRIRTNRQPVAPQGFSDLSLLCHKGTPSQSWHSRTAWTSKLYPPCWATTPQGSPWTPTPMSPPRCRPKPPTQSAVFSPALSSSFRTFPRMGQDMGQKKQAKIKTSKKYRKQTKPRRNQPISPGFWHAVRDSNPRPSGP